MDLDRLSQHEKPGSLFIFGDDPLPKQSHKPSPRTHKHKSTEQHLQRRLLHRRTKHKLMRHKLDQPRIQQNSRRDGVKDAVGDERGLAAGRVRGAHAETDGDGDGRGEGVGGA